MGIDILIPDCFLGLGYFYFKRRNMTKQDIINMAIEAGWDLHQSTFDIRIKAFAALVASAERERIKQANAPEIERINAHIKELEDDVKAEREACAKIGDEHPSWSSRMYSATIRARGQE
jgi:hypothetical protein